MDKLVKYYSKLRFFQIFTIVLVLLVVGIATTVTLVTVRMSENFFIEMYTIHSTRVINQIRRNLVSFHHSVTLTMDAMQSNSTIKNILVSEQTPKEMMISLLEMGRRMDDIKSNMASYPTSIVVTGCTYGENSDFVFHTDYDYWPIDLEGLSNSLVRMDSSEIPRNIQYHYDKLEISGSQSEPYVVIKHPLLNRPINHRYGTAFIAIKNSAFAELYNSHTHEGSHMFIVNSEGTIISSDQGIMVGTINPEFLSIIEEGIPEYYSTKTVDEKEQIIMVEYLPYLDLYIFNMIDRKLVIEGVIDKVYIVLIVVSIVVIFSVIMFIVTRKITNSLANLADEISETANLQFKQYITASGPYETQEIALVFNKMLDELHIYVEKLMLTQKQKREAELTGLQRQINIHFLYNTLTSVKFLVRQKQKEDAIETINDLIAMLQFTVGDMNEVAHIEREVECLESYVRISQKRYSDRIQVHVNVDPNVRNSLMPKLIIQPFIENAFAHAFPDKKEGNIDVFIWSEADVLICEIIDNGVGFDTDSQSETVKTGKPKSGRYPYFSGVGIKNVRERLQILYDTNYEIDISSKVGQGTIVTIRMPNIEEV